VTGGEGPDAELDAKDVQPRLRSAVPAQPTSPAAERYVLPEPPTLPEPATTAEADTTARAATPAAAAPEALPTPDVVPAGAAVWSHRLRRAGYSLRGWVGRPVGRVLLPTALIVAMLGLAGATGAYVVPKLGPKAAATASPAPQDAGPTVDQDAPPPVVDTPEPTDAGDPGEPPAARPGAALPAWATPIAGRLGIPVVAMQAYGYAELALTTSKPTCQLRWTTLAGIGKVESNHGRDHATLDADGHALPPIIGPPLDGKDNRQTINDTDHGELDHDTVWDRAVGPMQFIPNSWRAYGVDADGDHVADPNDIYDAALAAGRLLCDEGRDLSTAAGWWAAVLRYNAVQAYAQDVFNAANDYGLRSRS
jgi:hypothetical protein